MAVSYNLHRQKVDISRQCGYKRKCSPQDEPENVTVKYVNKRCSLNHTHNGNSPSSAQKIITITVKNKNNTREKKQLNETQRVKKSAPSLITIDDYLKVLAKKCSTPDAHQTYVHRNQKSWCSDTSLNTSTPFRTKTVVNTVSLDPEKIPPDFKNLLNHPLMQAQLSIYRCQVKKEKDTGCRTCNSTAIFEVVKCLYDCYKKKKCDPCKCVVCGYLPKDIRKLIKEVGTTSVNIGVETPSTNRKTIATMTPEEAEMLSMLQNEAKPEKPPNITVSEKLRMVKAFGILTPPESSGGVKMGRASQKKENNTNFLTKTNVPYLEGNNSLEKMFNRANLPDPSAPIRIPSNKFRKARASGLLTPLEGKTQEQREKMLRRLAMNDIPLPQGKTESEKNVIAKVRRELGLPPGPNTAAEKEKYTKAQAAGLITPLKGKSPAQKENILRALLEIGIPLPEGRTPPEKALIEKIELEYFLKPITKSDTEKTIKSKARSYVHTLFNKFATEAGYMVLVETSCVKDKFRNLQVKDVSSIEAQVSKEEENMPSFNRPKETKSLEKALFKEVKIGVRLIPKSQGKTQIGNILREKDKESVELRDSQVLSKKSIKRQPDSRTPFVDSITKSKDKLLPCIVVAGNPLEKSRISSENLFHRRVKDKAKGRKSESEQAKLVKGLVDAKLSVTKDYVPQKYKDIDEVRDKPEVLENKTCETSGKGIPITQKMSQDMVEKIITKLVSRIKEDLDNTNGAIHERSGTCNMKKLSFRKSYLTIKLSGSDICNKFTRRETRSVYTDTKNIKHTCDIATSVLSIANSNSTAADETEDLDKVPTKEIKKENNNNFANDKKQLSSGTKSTIEETTSESTFCFHFASDDTDDVASESHDNTYKRELEENADIIYIYKPTFDVTANSNGMLTTSSRIILTDSYNMSPTTSGSSGSLYLIETGSTDSYDSTMTDFSYATKDTSETETGTDAFYLQQSADEHSKNSSSGPKIFWFYRVIHNAPTEDANIYLVSEVRMPQQRNRSAQRPKYQLDPNKHCNGLQNSRTKLQVMQNARSQNVRRSSSIVIVMPQSRNDNDEFSSEELGSLIYVEKLDSVSELKTIKFVPHENTQKVDPIKMPRRQTRNKEKVIKDSVDPKTTLKRPETKPTPRHASRKLPVTKAFTRYPCNKSAVYQGNRLENSAAQFQKQRIPPKRSENKRMATGNAKWNKYLSSELSSCSTTCRLGMSSSEQRMGYLRKQRSGPKYFEIGPSKTGPTRGSKDPLYRALTRYLRSSKRTSCREKPTKWLPDQRLVTKSSNIFLISPAHSSKYRDPSKVSFSDELKHTRRRKVSEPCGEKCLEPNCPNKDPCKGPKCKNSHISSATTSDEKAKRSRDRTPEISLKIVPKSSRSNLKTVRISKERNVLFDGPNGPGGGNPPCCTCDKRLTQQSAPDLSKNQLDPDGSNTESGPRDQESSAEKANKSNETTKKQQPNVTSPEDKTEKDRKLAQTSTDKQDRFSLGCCPQCPEIVKRRSASSLNVKSAGVVGAAASKPNDEEQPRTVRPEKDKMPENHLSGASDGVKTSEHISNEEKPTKDLADKQPTDDNIKRSQQLASECPAPNSTRCPTEQTAGQPESEPTPCAPELLTQKSDPHSECEEHAKYTRASDIKDVKGRAWWHKKKQGHPPPSRLVEEQTAVTQCEKNVRDLVQMKDDLKQMTQHLMGMSENLECHCGGTVKPCQCLQELALKTSSRRKIAKTSSKCECPPPILIIKGQTVATPTQCKVEQAPSTTSPHVSNNNTMYECPPQTPYAGERSAIEPNLREVKGLGQNEKSGTCQGMSESDDKKNITIKCEFLPPNKTTEQTATDQAAVQNEKGGTCQGMSESDDKKNITIKCELLQPKAIEQLAASQNEKDGTCQGMTSDRGDKNDICPRPTSKVTEQTTAVQCQKGQQPLCVNPDRVDPCQSKQTVICESPSKDMSCQADRKATSQKQKSGGQKKELTLCLGKKKPRQEAEYPSSDCRECQNLSKQSSRVKWCPKKYVISDCPPPPLEDDRDTSCSSPQKIKQLLKNIKNPTKIKTEEKKVDSSCTHGAAPCFCKDDPLGEKKKSHKCECPCPLFVEEVDLNAVKDCPPPPPCPPKEKVVGECNQDQMTESKKDKSSYTDRLTKNICKTKNKASGHGKWGKKKVECICPPQPPTEERGCDPPCPKEQREMRSRDTRNISGFTVKKRPAPRVNHNNIMCFEDALAYFEQHPEDDPMRKMKKKLTIFELVAVTALQAQEICIGPP